MLCRVITGDDTWIFEYTQETKCQRNQWKSLSLLRLKKTRRHNDHVLQCEGHGPQPSSCHRVRQRINKCARRFCSVYFTQWVKRVVVVQTIDASLWQCSCSQHPEYLAAPGKDEHCCTEIPSLFICIIHTYMHYLV